jgi:hypothetical protein
MILSFYRNPATLYSPPEWKALLSQDIYLSNPIYDKSCSYLKELLQIRQ